MKDLEWAKKEIRQSKIMDYIPENHERWLYDLIDQVEQPELPVIPDYVAEDYERAQGYGGADIATLNYWTQSSGLRCRDESYQWLIEQDLDTITNLLHGRFIVEEKKRYKVLGKGGESVLLVKDRHGEIVETSDMLDEEYTWISSEVLTEQEIKDYDERYFAFAVKVEELEE